MSSNQCQLPTEASGNRFGRGCLSVLAVCIWQLSLVPSHGRVGVGVVSAADVSPNRVDFQREIRPILSDKCFFCHGPDEKHREAKLRLDTLEGMFLHREEATIVTPKLPGESELWKRITAKDADQRMPPSESGKSLSEKERQLIRLWIEQGAEWSDHWAYAVPVRAGFLSGKNTDQPIDLAIRSSLVKNGLDFSPMADPHTLIRRYAFDLTGLPPSPEEVEVFVKQFKMDADTACRQLVERLLASPHYAERMAMYWLDLVRYADTVGYHGDQEHHISPYRDYVIQAFHENMPFDQFTREQLAGDLLPDATVEQKIASGYNRLLQTSHEGGVQQKEYLAKYSADRVRNFGSVWLGATLGCCECHDHKFDPLPQRDFYRLAAFFADIDDLRSFKAGDTTPAKREPEMDVTTKLVPKETRRTMITVAIAPRPIRVLSRGDWMDDGGEIVEPGVPLVFKQLSPAGRDAGERATGERPTRLDLANWVTSRDNPLAARVFVNRLWKLFHGRGLSRSLEDFGAQGEAPDHPELLDWLAVEFIDSGWDVQHMVKLMVLTRTYRQSSEMRSAEFGLRNEDRSNSTGREQSSSPSASQSAIRNPNSALDSDNRQLARQSRWRLEAETVRDNALAVSGLLVRQVGGRSTRPYQPDGYYRFLNFPKRDYTADTGEAQYRRGLYTHWQRAYLHPMLKAFDAPSREECSCERPQSNTPLAALVLLNDPTFVEAARVFAARILREGGSSPDERIRWAWQTSLSRPPTDRELAATKRLLEAERLSFAADPAAAPQLLKTGLAPIPPGLDPTELAAWTSVARTLFNLNEFVTRN